MPSNQIQLKWASGFTLIEMDNALNDLAKAEQPPEISTTMKINGPLSRVAIAEIRATCGKYDLDLGVTLTASWPAGEQLRLAWPEEEGEGKPQPATGGGTVTRTVTLKS